MIVPSIGTCKARISFNQFLWASNYERTRIGPGEKSDEIISIGAVPDPDCKLRSTFNPQGLARHHGNRAAPELFGLGISDRRNRHMARKMEAREEAPNQAQRI